MQVSFVEALWLDYAGGVDALANRSGRFRPHLYLPFLIAKRRHFDLNIDAIEQRAGDLGPIALNLPAACRRILFADRRESRRGIPCVTFLPCDAQGGKPKHFQYAQELRTLGDHLRKRRLELGLFQKHLAEQIEVDETTIYNWERNATSPQIHQLPAVIYFLGYNPLPVPETLSDTLRSVRKLQGLTQKEMARRLGIDPTTLARWETGKSRPSRKLLRMTEVGELFGRRGLGCFF